MMDLELKKTSRQSLFEKSLLAKTLVLIGIASGVVAVIFILVTLEITQDRAEKHAMERLNELIESTRSMASAACFAHDIALARETAKAFVKNGDVYSVVIRSDGKELARAVRADGKPAALRGFTPLKRTLYSPFDQYDKIGEIEVEPNWGAIHRKASEEMLYTALMMTLIAIGIVGAIAIVIIDLVIQPVNAISEKLHSINASKGEILPIPPNHASNELGQLVGDVNDLVGRLKASLQIEHESNLQRVVNERLRLAAEVFENSQEGIMITDSENRIVSVNKAFSEVTGYPQEEVLGKPPEIFSSEKHDHAFYEDMRDTLTKAGHWRGELWNRRKDGKIVPHSYSISSVKDKDGKAINYVAIFSDISERKAAEEKIEQLAHFDQLTGLPNRVMLQDHFRNALSMAHRNGEQLAVMFFDLDHFKNINDTLGHSIGDRLLKGVSGRIKTVIREEDTVSRLGGDEFIMILPRTDADGAAIVAEKLIKTVSSPYQIESHELLTTPSIGIAMYPDDGSDMETLSKNADAAMYQAKQTGRNRACFFTQEMQDRSVRNMKLGNALMRAIGNNQLTLCYQPQISMQDGRITGAEALLRWHHPEFGSVSPAEFIPIAESSGQIVQIGEWVLRTAAMQMKEWLNRGLPPMVMSVNLSAVQFRHVSLLNIVSGILDEAQLSPRYLELELTEAAAMDNPLAAIDVMKNLHQRGIRISIDDFGTGYSSLSYLKRFKVSKLKIDQSFVRDISEDPDDKAIVIAIINMASSLGLHTIAEGVETPSQLEFMKMNGCDVVQGYYFSKPLPAEEFEAFVRRMGPSARILSIPSR